MFNINIFKTAKYTVIGACILLLLAIVTRIRAFVIIFDLFVLFACVMVVGVGIIELVNWYKRTDKNTKDKNTENTKKE